MTKTIERLEGRLLLAATAISVDVQSSSTTEEDYSFGSPPETQFSGHRSTTEDLSRQVQGVETPSGNTNLRYQQSSSTAVTSVGESHVHTDAVDLDLSTTQATTTTSESGGNVHSGRNGQSVSNSVETTSNDSAFAATGTVNGEPAGSSSGSTTGTQRLHEGATSAGTSRFIGGGTSVSSGVVTSGDSTVSESSSELTNHFASTTDRAGGSTTHETGVITETLDGQSTTTRYHTVFVFKTGEVRVDRTTAV